MNVEKEKFGARFTKDFWAFYFWIEMIFFSFYLCAQGDKGFNKDGGLRIDMGTTNNPGTSQRFILLHKRRRKFYG